MLSYTIFRKIKNKLRVIKLKKMDALINDDFSIISSNCVGV